MKAYAIYNDDLGQKKPIGYLTYYEKAAEYIIELEENIEEWDVPILFQKYIREQEYTVPTEVSKLWVQERVIPSGRQNIGMILKNAKLKYYDEMKLLCITKGRCSQDNCYIKECTLPEHIEKRRSNNISDCYISGAGKIICFHKDDSVRRINAVDIINRNLWDSDKKEELYSVNVGTGGYDIIINGKIGVNADVILKYGELLNVSASDFKEYAMQGIVTTTEACTELNMTRQNMAYLTKKNKITPIIRGEKENLFCKGDIRRIATE